jgi:putative nucleotidyltransferase-like protein
MQLLVCCARNRVLPGVAHEIRKLAAGPLVHNLLFSLASEHSVTPLLCRQLHAVAGDLLDPALALQLQITTRAQVSRSLAFTGALVTLLDRFQSQRIQAIPYKGPVLAAQAYGNLALRDFGDLDIILRQRDMPTAHDVMIAAGYRPKFPWNFSRGAEASPIPGEYAYRDESRGILVELHTERTLRHFPVPPDLDDLTSRLVPVFVGGHNVLTFSPEDTLVLLCVHGCKDSWEKLLWIADVAELVQAFPRIDWDRCVRLAESLRAQRMLLVGLNLASRIFSVRLPDRITSLVRGDSVADSIAARIERNFFVGDRPSPGAAARFNYRRGLLAGPLAGWRYALRLTVAPSDDDWSTMRLPRFLSPLYFALRPLRLLRKYGVTGTGAPRQF